MVSEQERNESKRRQAQCIKVAKDKGLYKGRSLLYSPNCKDSQKRTIYYRVVEMLEEGQAISKIAKEVNLTKLTVYRITILFWFYKLFFNASQNK
ncbi:recombinase family protein [Staphylococcus epidermidis]|nr:recombinase family protein [Staphylococcus epidermidis]MBF2296224.1 recombinase family protein [Staphylococcus epidermidis]MBF2305407.1 recombinase family protein [Staphylococcus epidermidis]MBF2314551.1 recombinase family protein [Staphylococcus epidermidis]MCG1791895.1 helix-turn-helix domain-containing protein [Staphylococcus epidermidis]